VIVSNSSSLVRLSHTSKGSSAGDKANGPNGDGKILKTTQEIDLGWKGYLLEHFSPTFSEA
jgi:hypothetical protein